MEPLKRELLLGVCSCILLVSIEVQFSYKINRTMILSFFFAVGCLIKKYEKYFYKCNKWTLFILSCLAYYSIAKHNDINMGLNEYRYKLSFVAGALLASYIVFRCSRIIDNWKLIPLIYIKKSLCFLGKNSIHVVIWQFVAFKIVIMYQMYRQGLNPLEYRQFYPTYYTDGLWWSVYLIVGLIVPVAWGMAIRYIVKLVKARIWGRVMISKCD